MAADAPLLVVQALASALNASPAEVRASGLNQAYPWVRNHDLWWAVDRARRAAVVAWARGSSEGPILLTRPNGWMDVGRLLSAELGELPGPLSAGDLAMAIRSFGATPIGLLATPQIIERADGPPMGAYVGRDAERAGRLRALLAEPRLLRSPDGTWRLHARFLNQGGGVDEWTVEGSPETLRSVDVVVLAPDGAFMWPYEG